MREAVEDATLKETPLRKTAVLPVGMRQADFEAMYMQRHCLH
jgi:hypothetical protein